MSLLRSHTPYPLLPPYLSPLLARPLCFLSFVVLKSEQRWKTGKMLWHAEWRRNKASIELARSLSHAMFPSTQISTCRYTNVRLSRAVNTVFIICEQTSILPKINLYKTERWQQYKHFLHTQIRALHGGKYFHPIFLPYRPHPPIISLSFSISSACSGPSPFWVFFWMMAKPLGCLDPLHKGTSIRSI